MLRKNSIGVPIWWKCRDLSIYFRAAAVPPFSSTAHWRCQKNSSQSDCRCAILTPHVTIPSQHGTFIEHSHFTAAGRGRCLGQRNKRRNACTAFHRTMSLFSQLLPDFPEKAEDAVNKRIYIATRPYSKRVQRSLIRMFWPSTEISLQCTDARYAARQSTS